MHPAAIPIEDLLKDCSIETSRRSGPGGQHRNKVETAVVITHQPSGIIGQASEQRSQKLNHDEALRRLRLNLAIDLRQPFNAQTSELWRSRMLGKQSRVSLDHVDYPALLAEALDALFDAQHKLSTACESLGISAGRLVKFISGYPQALQTCNAQRSALGLHPLKPIVS
jgi:hypothetical protein